MKKRPVNGNGLSVRPQTRGASDHEKNSPLAPVDIAQIAIDLIAKTSFSELSLTADVTGEPGDALTVYLRNVRRTELFTAQEEFEFATKARAGDFAAR